eukprot:g18334.t1
MALTGEPPPAEGIASAARQTAGISIGARMVNLVLKRNPDVELEDELYSGASPLKRMGTKDLKREAEADKMMERILIEKKTLELREGSTYFPGHWRSGGGRLV